MTPIAKAPNPDRAVTGPAVQGADVLQRLRGYNPPDRTIDEQRQMSIDIHEAADEIERLRAQVAELEKDAKRYRWLRDGCCDKDTAASRIAQNEYGMHWDAAIDAARKE